MVESLPADAGDAGSCPSPGRSHMPKNGWAREPWLLGLHIRSLCSAMGEAIKDYNCKAAVSLALLVALSEN